MRAVAISISLTLGGAKGEFDSFAAGQQGFGGGLLQLGELIAKKLFALMKAMFEIASCGCFLIVYAGAGLVGSDHFTVCLRGGCHAGID